ncbi:MAG: (deoxy)nucleoside triphosphate pyrophosphohydrolase [Oceanidesulfovibrio sp.]
MSAIDPSRSELDRPGASYVPVVAAIIWREGQFLAVQRRPGSAFAGMWEFPGGKVDPGESLNQALVRELREELGITPERSAFRKIVTHHYETLSVRLYFFDVHAYRGALHAREGHQLEWLAPDEAHAPRFLEADRDILTELAAEIRGHKI